MNQLITMREHIEHLKVKTTSYSQLCNYLDMVREYCHFPKAKMGMLIGDIGIGKTRACELYTAESPRYEQDSQDILPVIYIKLSGDDALSDVYRRIYSVQMGAECSPPGKNAERQAKVIKDLKSLKTELVIIDEAQHMMTRDSNVTGPMASFINSLKFMVEESNVPFVAVGVEGLERLLTLGGRHQKFAEQLTSRAVPPETVKTMSLKEVTKTLKSYTEYLTKKGVATIKLNDPLMAARFYLATGGSHRLISSQIITALVEKDGELLITQDSLRSAAERLPDYNGAFDYSKQSVEVKLRELKQGQN